MPARYRRPRREPFAKVTVTINVPNQITMVRLALAVLFFVLLCQFDIRQPKTLILDLSLVTFIVACLTDWLDGFVARRTDQVTSLGRVLDPFVDKVLVCGAYILFCGGGFVNEDGRTVTMVAPWMVVVIVGRELLVSGIRGFSESKGQAFAADIFGKIKAWAQMITAGCIMFFVAHARPDGALATLTVVLLWITVATTAISGCNYLYKARTVFFPATG